MIAAVRAMRSSRLTVTPKSGFAIGQVGIIQSACVKYRANKVRIAHSPNIDNKAHVSVKAMPRNEVELFELLATEAWVELALNKDITD